jgi:threonine aldolase
VANRSFGSDNHAGAHPAVLAAVSAANTGDVVAYGNDDTSREAIARLCALSGAHKAYLVFNGTAANLLGLSVLLRPYEAVICAESSHLNVDECGAAERVLGCKLLTVPTPDGKLTPQLIESRLDGRGDEHRAQPRVVQLAQVTELGTCYSLEELGQIRSFCDANGLLCYIDGARLANAAAYLDCSIADIAAHADVLSFGGTKNGALGVEAVLIMRKDVVGAQFQRKQLMQLASKMRFLAAQMNALLDGDLWLANARQANTMARRLADQVAAIPGVRLSYAMQGNGVFAELSEQHAEKLQEEWSFHVWSATGDGRCIVRWMTAFNTSEAEVDAFAQAIRFHAVSRETELAEQASSSNQPGVRRAVAG